VAQEAIQKALAGLHGDATSQFSQLITVILGTISPSCEGQEAVFGSAMNVVADLQNCVNDLRDEMNDSNPADQTGLVAQVATQLDSLLQLLNGQGGASAEIQEALGTSVCSSLSDQLTSIRNMIYDPSDTSGYNPASSASTDFDLDPSDPNYGKQMQTFAQMINGMSVPGDPDQATEAYNAIATAGNTCSSTLSTQTNVIDTQIKTLSTTDQQWLGFSNDMFQSLLKVEQAASQHGQAANG
jgi:hypothetical protein